ncbi:MAG: hypothetical protein KAR83_06520 [Thermodesulfovibrionales bacterium]|nr:hypothetical protein [Thermodesulfovibrionales bacterium]
MDAEKALRLLGRLEKKIGELYDHFSGLFRSDEKVRELFDQLCMDEDSHDSVVQYQMRIVRQDPGAFGDVEVSESEINCIMDFIDKTIASKKHPTLKQAVELSLKIEGTASESHYRTALVQDNPMLGELIRSLGVSDEEHSKRLRDFVVSRNL